MYFRPAIASDIPKIQLVRNAVTENVLSNPDLISNAMCEDFIFRRGKGWVCEKDGQVVGFSIVDLTENNVWALFVHPNSEGQGVGSQLQRLMLDWYFDQTNDTLWLGTAPNTKAEQFYQKSGWKYLGEHGEHEVKFEMKKKKWKKVRNERSEIGER
jgi:GNAT superfamily N-acetyltransferase